MPAAAPTSPGYYQHYRYRRRTPLFPVLAAGLLVTCGTACFCWQGLVQYAAAEGLVTPLFRTPHSLPVAYKAAVIAVTCVGGCLVLLSLVLALLARKQQSSPEGAVAGCGSIACMQSTASVLLYLYDVLLVLLACLQATGTVYVWDARYTVRHLGQKSSSGGSPQSGCSQLTLWAQSATVCPGAAAEQLQSSLQTAAIHCACTLGGLLLMHLGISALMALASAAAARSGAAVHHLWISPSDKAPLPQDQYGGLGHAEPGTPVHSPTPSAPTLPAWERGP